MVKTVPPGATIALGGEQVLTSPATFQSVKLGKYPVKIILEGYEPMEVDVEIKENDFVDLGTLNMTRSTGSLQIAATPDGVDYELTSKSGAPADFPADTKQLKGKTPVTVNDLPTGTWIVTLKSPGFDPVQSEVAITRKAQTSFAKDFIVDRAAAGLPDNIRALLTSPQTAGITALDDAGKKQFTDAAALLFQEYLKANLFRKAKELDAALTAANITDATRATSLATTEQAWVTANQPVFEDYIKKQAFTKARPMLAQQQELANPSLMDDWKKDYDTAYASYQQAVQPEEDALKTLIANNNWTEAAAKVAVDEKNYPDEFALFSDGLQIDKASPNSQARVENRLARIDYILNNHLNPDEQTVGLGAERGGFANMIKRHKFYQEDIATLESEIERQKEEIPGLQAKKKAEADDKQSADSGKVVSQIFGVIPAVAMTQKSSNDHQANLNAINGKINSIDGEISSEESQLSNAKAAYATFASMTIEQALESHDPYRSRE